MRILVAWALLLDWPAKPMPAPARFDENWKRAGAIALGVALGYLLFFSQLGTLGLVGPDEPRYAQVARETAEQNHWITPTLYGSPWFEKPMLYYWLAAIAYKIGGVNETTARLPSAVAATITVIAFSALAWELYGWTAAQLTFLLLAGSLGWLGFARAASTDMLFSATLNLALACLVLVQSTEDEKTRARSAYGFQIALGLALLAKGPAALVLAGGTVFLYILLTKEWKFLEPLLRPGPLGALLAVAAPWYVLVVAVNGWTFFQTFILSHNIQRFLTPVFHHEQGFWFFFVVLPLAIFPWTVLLAVPLVRLWRQRQRIRLAPSAELLMAVWIAVPLVFFSLSRSKLPGYILPAVPALCLLLAREMASEPIRTPLRWWLLAATASAFLAALVSPEILQAVSLPIFGRHAYRIELAVVLLGLCAVAWLAWRQRLLPWALALTVLTAGAVNATNWFLGEEINRYFSARPLARQIQAKVSSAVPSTYTFQVGRQLTYGLNFYLGHALPDAESQPIREEPAYLLLPSSELGRAQERLGRRLEVMERLEGTLVLARTTRDLPSAAPSGKK